MNRLTDGWLRVCLPRVVFSAALVAVLGAAGCAGRRAQTFSPAAPASSSPLVMVVPRLSVRPQAPTAEALPSRGWDISFDALVPSSTTLNVELGYGHQQLLIHASPAGGGQARLSGTSRTIEQRSGWPQALWHVEAENGELWVNGARLPVRVSRSHRLQLSVSGHPASVSSLIVSPAASRGALLLHRLAELHARLAPGHFPEGADRHDRIHLGDTYWTSGFWPGALWQAQAVAGAPFGEWALASTLRHFGQERSDTHDVGFIYGQSSLAAWNRFCHPVIGDRRALCEQLRGSVLAAAGELLHLAAGNRAAGTIPTNSQGSRSDTIVDSMMNLHILIWATRVTADPSYARVATGHARRVARLLVRADGSTAQAVDFDRASGRVLQIGTHQGISARSTWSRGEAWALYGFAQTAAGLRDRKLLRVALRVARYVSTHLPASGVPRWDYDAPPGSPVDVSAGAITAAGLFHLAQACSSLPGTCGRGHRWVALGDRMLAAALRHASSRPPLGFLGDQALNEHGRGCWCNGGELSFGLTYALEAIRLQRGG